MCGKFRLKHFHLLIFFTNAGTWRATWLYMQFIQVISRNLKLALSLIKCIIFAHITATCWWHIWGRFCGWLSRWKDWSCRQWGWRHRGKGGCWSGLDLCEEHKHTRAKTNNIWQVKKEPRKWTNEQQSLITDTVDSCVSAYNCMWVWLLMQSFLICKCTCALHFPYDLVFAILHIAIYVTEQQI